jgi:hypothetical protein
LLRSRRDRPGRQSDEHEPSVENGAGKPLALRQKSMSDESLHAEPPRDLDDASPPECFSTTAVLC